MVRSSATVLVANPSPDLYGADLQMLESVSALKEGGYRVVVAIPNDGPLSEKVRERGADVCVVGFPVLRRANQSAPALLAMIVAAVASVPRLMRCIRRVRPAVVYVNTVTLPWWLLAARLSRRPVICHLHEAENTDHGFIRRALVTPLRLSDAVIVISRSAMEAMVTADPGLRAKGHLIYNGVPEPSTEPKPPPRGYPLRALVVGRLAPRKAPHLALEAVARLRRQGYGLEVVLAGTSFPGYQWYADELHARAQQDDLAGSVQFAGYCSPIWTELRAADLMIAPSLREPFGNAVVEAQLSLRPVVATDALGHTESIVNGETGLLVPSQDVEAMATAIASILDDEDLAARLAVKAREAARARFSTARYRQEVFELVQAVESPPCRSR